MRKLSATIAVAMAASLAPGQQAIAQQSVKIGLILPLTGPQASSGRQMLAGARLYQALNGDMAAGKKIELIVRDDAGVADQTRRMAQELIVNDKVAAIAGCPTGTVRSRLHRARALLAGKLKPLVGIPS
jgi:branched-chain amino acid transport system substrate-binding protein